MSADQSNAGRPAYEPNDKHRETVISMASNGFPQIQIASVLGLDVKTLTKYYRYELDNSAAKANNDVARALYDKAMSGDTTAQIWWTKARMKWSGEQTIHHTGINIKVEDKEDTEL